LCYKDLSAIYKLPIPYLKHPSWFPLTHHRLREDLNIFDSIKKGDILVHHPYDSFSTSVDRLVSNAADDPNVIAIKMTLYRTSEDSPIIASLIRAAERGKHVVCLVEIKARLEEERNIHWAQKLENAGAHVVYGIIGLKTHCKVTLIIRKENDDFIPYAHIGTGNYNGNTAKLYEDFGLFIRDNAITDEMIELFNFSNRTF
jgi:polyphosphate kinase